MDVIIDQTVEFISVPNANTRFTEKSFSYFPWGTLVYHSFEGYQVKGKPYFQISLFSRSQRGKLYKILEGLQNPVQYQVHCFFYNNA